MSIEVVPFTGKKYWILSKMAQGMKLLEECIFLCPTYQFPQQLDATSLAITSPFPPTCDLFTIWSTDKDMICRTLNHMNISNTLLKKSKTLHTR